MRQRLINCDFLNSSSFFDRLSNKAKLLYIFMFLNGDDQGFVDNTMNLIESLEKNDKEYDDQVSLSLLENDYLSALNDLITRGYVYEFRDKHNNAIHLIRHWFFHNQWKRGLWTNYRSFLKRVDLVENEYILKETHLKENKLNESKVNEIKLNDSSESETKQKSMNDLIKELDDDEVENTTDMSYQFFK